MHRIMDYHIMDYKTVIKRIESYMSKFEGGYSNWYVGITSDLDEELFEKHKVDEKGIWISFGADTEEVAGKVQKYFLDKKTDGILKDSQIDSRIVYAYKKNTKNLTIFSHTQPIKKLTPKKKFFLVSFFFYNYTTSLFFICGPSKSTSSAFSAMVSAQISPTISVFHLK